MRAFIGTLILRLGIVFALLYPAVMSFVNPDKWAALLPAALTVFISAKNLLMILAAYDLLFAILILVKSDPGWAAGMVFLTFIIFTVLGYKDFDLVYQNITVAFAALTLVFLGKTRG